jgi:isopentenyl diphosphate isomerase/L-lactate dehydrogenase-like FMN-dependent dehydrogenase
MDGEVAPLKERRDKMGDINELNTLKQELFGTSIIKAVQNVGFCKIISGMDAVEEIIQLRDKIDLLRIDANRVHSTIAKDLINLEIQKLSKQLNEISDKLNNVMITIPVEK